MMRSILSVLVLGLLSASSVRAADIGVLGFWTEPSGSTIQVERCADGVCLKLVGISKAAPTRVDSLNPDPSLRTRALCGLQIGSHFRLTDAGHAEGGTLYDPKSGKTYSGSMSSEGDKLKLRGYVGAKMFGRSQTWTRAAANAAPCQSQ